MNDIIKKVYDKIKKFKVADIGQVRPNFKGKKPKGMTFKGFYRIPLDMLTTKTDGHILSNIRAIVSEHKNTLVSLIESGIWQEGRYIPPTVIITKSGKLVLLTGEHTYQAFYDVKSGDLFVAIVEFDTFRNAKSWQSNKIMCLQPILEGSGVFVKKINKFVKPKDGFNVIATANTKGQGSEDGKFIGTNVLNEAFLERFPITFEQSYPTSKIEKKILTNTLNAAGKKDADFIDKLTTWADVIRKTYFDGGVDEIISTRRLVHITQAFAIFDNKMKAIQMCTNRFDDDTKNSFVELYTKVDAGANAESIMEDQRNADINSQVEDNDSESDKDEDSSGY